jgi:hypothetical protein
MKTLNGKTWKRRRREADPARGRDIATRVLLLGGGGTCDLVEATTSDHHHIITPSHHQSPPSTISTLMISNA